MSTRTRVLNTGATGMVGESVLHETLQHPNVESVLVINRKPCDVSHPKLKEIILGDFFNLSSIESQLSGFNACFFCAGVLSIGVKKPEYRRIFPNFFSNLWDVGLAMVNCVTIAYDKRCWEQRISPLWRRNTSRNRLHNAVPLSL